VRRQAGPAVNATGGDLDSTWAAFEAGGRDFWLQMDALTDMLDGALSEEALDA
jgi:hypothetical protein